MTMGNKKYKDRLFTFIFGNEENREWTLSLYNAVNGSAYSDKTKLEFTTIKDVLYLGMHNDVSFLIHDEMNLYEHQSTFSPNIPVRMLQYMGRLFEQFIISRKLNKFGRTLIGLPEPKLVVFYNGIGEQPDTLMLQLSDAFDKFKSEQLYSKKPDVGHRELQGCDYDISVRVRMVNINHGHSKALMEACKPLFEYAWIVQAIRDNLIQGDRTDKDALADAITKMIHDIPDDFILKPFLMKHHAEIVSMLLTEYNETEVMDLFREEGKQDKALEVAQAMIVEGLDDALISRLSLLPIGLVRKLRIEMMDSSSTSPQNIRHGDVDMLLTEYNETEVMNLFREEGKQEGLKEGKREVNALYARLLQAERMDDLKKAIVDPVFLEKLVLEFNDSEKTE